MTTFKKSVKKFVKIFFLVTFLAAVVSAVLDEINSKTPMARIEPVQPITAPTNEQEEARRHAEAEEGSRAEAERQAAKKAQEELFASISMAIQSNFELLISEGLFEIEGDIYTSPVKVEVRSLSTARFSIFTYYQSRSFGYEAEDISEAVAACAYNWLKTTGQRSNRISVTALYREDGNNLRRFGVYDYDVKSEKPSWKAD